MKGWRTSRGYRRLPSIAALVASACGAAPATPQRVTCVNGNDALAAAMRSVHEKQQNVGVSAAVFVDGQLVFDAAMGFADLEHRVPATLETVFGAASITKAVTAVAVLKLWSEGRLDLDAPVQRYVASFAEREEGIITPRLLATHRSGLPHPSERTPEFFATHYGTATEALAVFGDVPLVSRPGEQRVYSSSNYNLLAAMVEAITGRRFQDRVQDAVLDSADMPNTRFDDVLAVIPHRAARYTFYHPWTYEESEELLRVPMWDYSFNMGGGGLLSTAADLARFGGHLLEPGLLTPDALDLFFSDAWFGRVDADGERWALITGANPGVQAGLAIFPARRAAAAVLANTWGRGSRSAEMVRLPRVLVDACPGDGSAP